MILTYDFISLVYLQSLLIQVICSPFLLILWVNKLLQSGHFSFIGLLQDANLQRGNSLHP